MTAVPTFPTPQQTIAETTIWTALPQGVDPNVPTTLRLGAMVNPQLTFTESIGFRSETSTELATFPDWVNWPETVKTMTFQVGITVGNNPIKMIPVTFDTSALQPSYWAAMFGAETTRVDNYQFEDFTQAKPTSFAVKDAHSTITGLYNNYASGVAGAKAKAPVQTSGATPIIDPAQFNLDLVNNPGLLNNPLNNYDTIPANTSAAAVLNPKPLAPVIAYHQAPVNNTSLPVTSIPILDFHQAIASLGHFPEMLRYFGLLIPLEVPLEQFLPQGAGSTVNFTVAVYPSWPANLPGPVPQVVPLATNCTYSNGTCFSTPRDKTTYVDGALNLSNPDFMFIDVDVDRAAHGVNNLRLNLNSTAALHANAPTGTTVPYKLPAIRGTGPQLVWSGWGQKGSGLNDLATSQLAINTAIKNWLNLPLAKRTVQPGLHGAPPVFPNPYPARTLNTEDITRGWRLDVQDTTARSVAGPWQSLHWRQATFVFGAEGTPQISWADPTPIEGMISPAVSHVPTPNNAVPQEMFVHEVVAHWSGWSLSAPRPGGQVNDDGTISPTAAGNPAVATFHTDEYGNFNPQISATFGCPPAGLTAVDQFGNTMVDAKGNPVKTGLPPLRYGHTYRFAVRTVDLGGWSIAPGTAPASSFSQDLSHSRWEPVKSPLMAPLAPLTTGEGVHTIVLRDDGVTPPTSNGRWIFPPRVHQTLAERHGALDTNQGVPDTSEYDTINAFNDGSLASIGTADETFGTTNIIVPGTLPDPTDPSPNYPPRPAIDWLPDPASYGYALSFSSPPGSNFEAVAWIGTTPFTSFSIDPTELPGLPNPSPVFADAWAFQDDGRDEAWPRLKGKLLVIKPIASAVRTLNGGRVAVPETISAPGSKPEDSPDTLVLGIVPGAVYEMGISSIIPQNYLTVNRPVFGLVPDVFATLTSLLQSDQASYGLSSGQVSQITPSHSMRIVYAVLLPKISPAFSGSQTFTRQLADTTVTIQDPNYQVDLPTTSTVTYTVSWTDPVDDPSDLSSDPTTDTFNGLQSGLVLTTFDLYAPPVAQDPMVPVAPPPPTKSSGSDGAAPPFGTVGEGQNLQAIHHIGDTKHHLMTYTPTATSRFPQFFAVSKSITLFGTEITVVDDRGVDANTFSLEVTSSGNKLVPNVDYFMNTDTGQLSLAPKKVNLNGPNPPLSGTPLTVKYVPTDTVSGAPYQVHVPSTTAPPSIKVTKVAPSWKLTSTGTPGQAGYSYKRTGNALRVYMERPWFVTGPNEMVGVLGAAAGAFINNTNTTGKNFTRDAPNNVDLETVTLMALDPINVPNAGSAYTQGQLEFTNTNHIDATGGTLTGTIEIPGGNPVQVPFSLDPYGTLYNVWGYNPQFDSVTNEWYVDIELKMDAFTASPPPGYFVRLALARFQPYALSGPASSDSNGVTNYPNSTYLSPLTLVTYAQPVVNRLVTVVTTNGSNVVTVSGPGYQGWRPAPGSGSSTTYDDDDDSFAQHPNSDGKGTQATSTMVIELQSSSALSGFSGDLSWITEPGIYVMTPDFSGADITWQYLVNGAVAGIPIPTSNALETSYRLRISELDYFPLSSAKGSPPTVIDTSLRRTFVAHIPLATQTQLP